MNKVFDFKRFFEYLRFDVKNAASTYGVPMIILALCPMISFIFYAAFMFIIDQSLPPMPVAIRLVSASVALLVVCLGSPSKIYGAITDKRYGSLWLSIPASSLEKWLSMIIITCVILPICFLVTFLFGDSVMSLSLPEVYGKFIWKQGMFAEIGVSLEEAGISINFSGLAFLSWCEMILIFLIGALCFKKGKVAKTILAYFIVSTVLGTLMTMVMFDNIWEYVAISAADPDPERFSSYFEHINLIIWIGVFLWSVLLLGGSYYRVRTIKH